MLHYSSIVRKLTISKKSETVEHETTFVWVLQARQVASNKKLILYVGLDDNIPLDILQEVIASFDACDCEITSVTCDMGPKNRGMATQLGITNKKFYFEYTDKDGNVKRIFWIWDFVHLFKLIRHDYSEYRKFKYFVKKFCVIVNQAKIKDEVFLHL